MKSLRIRTLRLKLTLAFGALMVVLLATTVALVDRQIQTAYEDQVTSTSAEVRNWVQATIDQLAKQLPGEVRQLTQNIEVVRAVRQRIRGRLPEAELDLVEYGDREGVILRSSRLTREGKRTEYLPAGPPSVTYWEGMLAVIQSVPVQIGQERLGFVTGGYFLHDHLRRLIPPRGALLFLAGASGDIHPLRQMALPSNFRTSPFISDNVLIGSEPYRAVQLSLGASLGSLVVAIPRGELDQQRHRLRVTLLILSGLSIMAAIGAGYLLARGITRPVYRLSEAVKRLARGETDVQIEVESRDEIALLAQQFNGMVRDLQSLQQRLLVSERIAAWKDIARMMAHEIKNPLFPIQLSVESLQRTAEKRPECLPQIFGECTQTILDEVHKLRRIVDEFSQFARMPGPQFDACDINQIVDRTLQLYTTVPEGIEIDTALDRTLPRIQADGEQLGQLLQNLLKNAIEATDGTGRISLRTFGQKPTVADDAEGLTWIGIQCQDDGPGMSDEVQANLFRPYFTTKQGGTGLGMAIVDRIVAEHRGHIEIESAPGRGTTITVWLPESRPE